MITKALLMKDVVTEDVEGMNFCSPTGNLRVFGLGLRKIYII